jgi:transposase
MGQHAHQLDDRCNKQNHQSRDCALSNESPEHARFGVILGAEFLAATGGDMNVFDSADRLAGICGLAPVPRDSGRISGNLKRPRRYHRRLLRTCYLAAQSAARTDPASRTYYDRKRAEGKHHRQAVLALARRRLNVLWAMLRDHIPYETSTATAA